jgi:hypothetical protein
MHTPRPLTCTTMALPPASLLPFLCRLSSPSSPDEIKIANQHLPDRPSDRMRSAETSTYDAPGFAGLTAPGAVGAPRCELDFWVAADGSLETR